MRKGKLCTLVSHMAGIGWPIGVEGTAKRYTVVAVPAVCFGAFLLAMHHYRPSSWPYHKPAWAVLALGGVAGTLALISLSKEQK